MSINFKLDQLVYTEKLENASLEDLWTRFSHISNDIISLNASDELTVSQEGFLSNIFVGLFDTIFGVFSNISNTFAILSKVKGSELHVFSQRNMLRLKSIFNLSYTKVSMVKVQGVPFKIGYPELISFLNNNYEALNIVNTYQKIVTNFKEISTLIMNEFYADSIKSIKGLKAQIDLKTTKKILDIVTDNFFLTNTSTVEFGKMFSSMKEFKQTYQTMSSIADRFGYIGKVNKSINPMKKSIEKIMELDVEKKKDLSLAMKDCGEVIFDVANYYEAYANLMKIQLRLDHNFVSILSTLKKISKK